MNKEDMILEALAKQGEVIAKQGEMLADLKAEVSDIRATQIQQGGQLVALQATQTQQGGQLAALQATQTQQGEQLAAMQTTQTEMQSTQSQQSETLKRLEEQVAVIDERSHQSAAFLEADVARDVRRLYEDHGAIMRKLDKLTPKERVDVLEDDVLTIKSVIRSMSARLAALEKAQ